MHTAVNRCFLNEGTVCDGITHEDVLSQSSYYRLYWKQRDVVDDGNGSTWSAAEGAGVPSCRNKGVRVPGGLYQLCGLQECVSSPSAFSQRLLRGSWLVGV